MKQRLLLALVFFSVGALAQHNPPGPCNRPCLNRLVDSYLAAVVAHDPSRVPIAENAKFVENTVPMKPGEGLWKNASEAPSTFKIYVPDPTVGEVGFLGMMKEKQHARADWPAPESSEWPDYRNGTPAGAQSER